MTQRILNFTLPILCLNGAIKMAHAAPMDPTIESKPAFRVTIERDSSYALAHSQLRGDAGTEYSATLSLPILDRESRKDIFVGSSHGHIVRLSADGRELKWRFKADLPNTIQDLPFRARFGEFSNNPSERLDLWGDEIRDADFEELFQLKRENLIVAASQSKSLYFIESSTGRLHKKVDIRRILGTNDGSLFLRKIQVSARGRIYALVDTIRGINRGGFSTPQVSRSRILVLDSFGNRLWLYDPKTKIHQYRVKSYNHEDQIFVTQKVGEALQILRVGRERRSLFFKRPYSVSEACFQPFRISLTPQGEVALGNNHQGCGCKGSQTSVWILKDNARSEAQVRFSAKGLGCVEAEPVVSAKGLLFVSTLMGEFTRGMMHPEGIRCADGSTFGCVGKLHLFNIYTGESYGSQRLSHTSLGVGGTDGAPEVMDDLVFAAGNIGHLDVFRVEHNTKRLLKIDSVLTASLIGGAYGDEIDGPVKILNNRVFVSNQGGTCGSWNKAHPNQANPQNRACRLYSYPLTRWNRNFR